MAIPPIPPQRRVTFYVGTGMMVVGGLLFFSVFVEGALSFGDFSNFEHRSKMQFLRAVIGMGLVVAGGFLRGLGAAGAAGSGLTLDPEQARRDLEPLNRSRGAMVKDALDEADIHLGQTAMPFDEKLRRLHALQKDGLISESEYQSAKQRLLADPR